MHLVEDSPYTQSPNGVIGPVGFIRKQSLYGSGSDERGPYVLFRPEALLLLAFDWSKQLRGKLGTCVVQVIDSTYKIGTVAYSGSDPPKPTEETNGWGEACTSTMRRVCASVSDDVRSDLLTLIEARPTGSVRDAALAAARAFFGIDEAHG